MNVDSLNTVETATSNKRTSAVRPVREGETYWLGKVPSNWPQKRLKFAIQLVNDKSEAAGSELPYVGMENIQSATGRLMPGYPEDSADGLSNVFRHDDVLFGKLRPYLAKVLHANGNGLCSSELLVFRPRDVLPRFLFYYCLSTEFIRVVDSSTYGSKMPRASWQFIGNLPVLIPPRDEQQAMTAFLDRETAQIDELIAANRRMIELLQLKQTAFISRAVTKGLDATVPMKASGIRWLGQIPAHWTTNRVRFLFDNLNHRRIPLSGEDRSYRAKVYPYYGASGVIDAVDEYIFDEPLILIAEDGANLLSRSTPLAFVAEGKYWVNNHAHIVRPRSGPIRYWEAALQLFDFTPFVSGSAQPKLTIGNLNNVVLPVPPTAEQEAITTTLEAEKRKLDQVINTIQRAIEQLIHYRAAIITAAVTGQIDVRRYRTEAVCP